MPVTIIRKPAPAINDQQAALSPEEAARHAIGSNGGPVLEDASSLEAEEDSSACDDSIQNESDATIDRGDEHEVSFGKMIKEIRQEAGVSQRELSDLSGVSRGALRKIESDDRDGHIKTIARLAKVLGYEIDLIAVNPLPPKGKRRGGREEARA